MHAVRCVIAPAPPRQRKTEQKQAGGRSSPAVVSPFDADSGMETPRQSAASLQSSSLAKQPPAPVSIGKPDGARKPRARNQDGGALHYSEKILTFSRRPRLYAGMRCSPVSNVLPCPISCSSWWPGCFWRQVQD